MGSVTVETVHDEFDGPLVPAKVEERADERPSVPKSVLDAGIADVTSAERSWVNDLVAGSVVNKSRRTVELRLQNLARAVMTVNATITPQQVWASSWDQLDQDAVSRINAGINQTWESKATRNAARDAVRAVIKAGWFPAAVFSADERDRMLAAIPPETITRDANKQVRNPIPVELADQVFSTLDREFRAGDPIALRDAVIIGLGLRAGLRRSEIAAAQIEHLDDSRETLTIHHGKGDVTRDVPLTLGLRRTVQAWLAVRGTDTGALITKVFKGGRVTDSEVNPETIARVVRERFADAGREGVTPHDLRRTFTGDFLSSGADLSTVARTLGHANVQTTAIYDRRDLDTVREAIADLKMPPVGWDA